MQAAAQAALAKSMTTQLLEALHEKLGEHNVSNSIFEAKMGSRPALVKGNMDRRTNADLAEELPKSQYIRSLAKGATEHLKSTGQFHTVNPMQDLSKRKKATRGDAGPWV